MSALLGMFRDKKDSKAKKPIEAAASDTPTMPAIIDAPRKSPAAPIAPVRGSFRAGMVILTPHVTEKTVRAGQANTYTFIVRPSATKNTVRQAIRQLYGVAVASVNMIKESDHHRQTRFGSSFTRGRKKAMVTLAKGATIDLSKAPKAQ